MPTPPSFDYAILRLVPRVEREEFLNVGAVLFCLEKDFLEARYRLDAPRIRAFAPEVDLTELEDLLQAVHRVCRGGKDAGPLGTLSRKERFHWVVAPRSALVQVSAVHTGLCVEPDGALEHLMRTMVDVPAK